MSYIAQN